MTIRDLTDSVLDFDLLEGALALWAFAKAIFPLLGLLFVFAFLNRLSEREGRRAQSELNTKRSLEWEERERQARFERFDRLPLEAIFGPPYSAMYDDYPRENERCAECEKQNLEGEDFFRDGPRNYCRSCAERKRAEFRGWVETGERDLKQWESGGAFASEWERLGRFSRPRGAGAEPRDSARSAAAQGDDGAD